MDLRQYHADLGAKFDWLYYRDPRSTFIYDIIIIRNQGIMIYFKVKVIQLSCLIYYWSDIVILLTKMYNSIINNPIIHYFIILISRISINFTSDITHLLFFYFIELGLFNLECWVQFLLYWSKSRRNYAFN